MRFESRKMSVVAVLALLLVTQIIFSAIHTGTANAGEKNAYLADNGEQPTTTTVDLAIVDTTEAPVTAAPTEEETGFEVKEEVIQADINVVYRSTVSAAETVDVFETNGNKSDFSKKIVSYTLDKLGVHAEPSAESELTGIMYSGSEADVLEIGADWTKIQSGDVIGYVYNSDVLFGEEAEVIANLIGTCTASIANEGTEVYADTFDGATLIATLNPDDGIIVCDMVDDYYLISCDAGFGFVFKSEVNVSYGLAHAKTMEAIRQEEAEAAAEAARRAAEEAKRKAEEAKKNDKVVNTVYRSAFEATDEEVHLLAAIVYWEAGWEPFEGQVAVANVVINRVLSSKFAANTISKVIYSPGQFTGVAENGKPTARFQSILDMSNNQLNQRGCYDAALRALSGENNIDDYCFFISVKKANYARYIKYHIINNHCFYAY